MKYFSEFNIGKENIELLEKYKSRDGFIVVEEDNFKGMMDYFKEYKIYENLIPLLTDNNSNYWCIYYQGILKGMVCYLNHDEVELQPKFKDLKSLIETIEMNPSSYDFSDFNKETFDFPAKSELSDNSKIIEKLWSDFNFNNNEEVKLQLAHSIIILSSENEIENFIYPLLENEDTNIQEKAIELIEFHKYLPAKNKLIDLSKKTPTDSQIRTALRRTLKLIA